MALKLKKYGKKPKAAASLATMERYLARVSAIDKENAERQKREAERQKAYDKIRSIGSPASASQRRGKSR